MAQLLSNTDNREHARRRLALPRRSALDRRMGSERRGRPPGRGRTGNGRGALRARRPLPRPHRDAPLRDGRGRAAASSRLRGRDRRHVDRGRGHHPPLVSGSSLTWRASLHLRGARRLLDPPLRLAFARLGRKAEDGLRERLASPMMPKRRRWACPDERASRAEDGSRWWAAGCPASSPPLSSTRGARRPPVRGRLATPAATATPSTWRPGTARWRSTPASSSSTTATTRTSSGCCPSSASRVSRRA